MFCWSAVVGDWSGMVGTLLGSGTMPMFLLVLMKELNICQYLPLAQQHFSRVTQTPRFHIFRQVGIINPLFAHHAVFWRHKIRIKFRWIVCMLKFTTTFLTLDRDEKHNYLP